MRKKINGLKTKKPKCVVYASIERTSQTTIHDGNSGRVVDPADADETTLESLYNELLDSRQMILLRTAKDVLEEPDPEDDCTQHSRIVRDSQDWSAVDNMITHVFSEYIDRVAERTVYMQAVILAALKAAGANLHPYNKIEIEAMSTPLLALRLILCKHFALLHEYGRDMSAKEHIVKISAFVKTYVEENLPKETRGKENEDSVRKTHRRDVRSRSEDKTGRSDDQRSKKSSSRIRGSTPTKIRERIH